MRDGRRLIAVVFGGRTARSRDAHGLFENRIACDAFLDATFAAAGLSRPVSGSRAGTSPYDRAAALVADTLDLAALGVD